jgi:O-antigen/teichoic acid export membrane protein
MIETATVMWRRWRAPISVGVLDQGAASGANLVLNVLLARWMTPSNYGAFAVAFSVLLLVSGPHGALFTDPMSVVGPRHFNGRFPAYVRGLCVVHAGVAVALAILTAGLAVVPIRIVDESGAWFVPLAVAIPLVLLLWLLRSACYLEMRPGAALAGSALYGFVLVAVVTWGHASSRLTVQAALVAMALASAVASVAIAARLGLWSLSHSRIELRSVVREHWTYGRWILAASVAHAAAFGLYVPLVGTLAGLEQTAVLRALQNLVFPLDRMLGGIAMVAYPSMSRQVVEQGLSYLGRRGPAFVLIGVGSAILYGLPIAFLARPLLSLVYGTTYYSGYASLAPIIAVAAVATALAQFLSILVRVANRPQAVLWSKLAAAGWLAGVGILLIRQFGARGAVLGLAGGSIAEAFVLAVSLRRAVSAAPSQPR